MIEAIGLTKKYGGKPAVDNLSFTVRPGIVTGFLGPNGSGKSTTMRMILGLTRPDSGTILVNGVPFSQHSNPLGALGASIDAKSGHPGRTAFRHLQAIATTIGIGTARIRTVLDMVGLSDVADRRIGGFSLGMSQRLGVATALLADPANVMFDEPINGLDPDGILWMRNLVKKLAAEGRGVLLSSHLMSEMAVTADHVVVIGRGRLIADEAISSLIHRGKSRGVLLRTPRGDELGQLVRSAGGQMSSGPDESLRVDGMTAAELGDLAAVHRIPLHELIPVRASLEEAFMELTADSVTFSGR
ncbi:ATP-binding cassette domain-containing protein [Actinoplanes sp. NEAU-A12]|uniref:ATP-binding cassette domain-containing protein n=1 Tax=Actinoplanes sandaracinus TaxID=3045177 RepID=A0ABT6WVW5_9ACTN|nr:ATP-binding cassette domain-containing protein [Actinoplanes sandaracinus]MDI6103888.1 ATP-binding cassette domain-containing protein [Actinoplanes sandaracinus]